MCCRGRYTPKGRAEGESPGSRRGPEKIPAKEGSLRPRRDLVGDRRPSAASRACATPTSASRSPGPAPPTEPKRGHCDHPPAPRLLEPHPYASIGPGSTLPRHPSATRCPQVAHSHVRCPGATVSFRQEQAAQPTRARLLPHAQGPGRRSAHPSLVRTSDGISFFPSSSVSSSPIAIPETVGTGSDIEEGVPGTWAPERDTASDILNSACGCGSPAASRIPPTCGK